jgi:hypothetical protein
VSSSRVLELKLYNEHVRTFQQQNTIMQKLSHGVDSTPSVYLYSNESLTYNTLYETINNEIQQVNSQQHKYYHCVIKAFSVTNTKVLSLQLFIDPESLSQKLSDAQYRAYGINRTKYITVEIDIHDFFIYMDKVLDNSVNVFQSGNVSTKDYSNTTNKSFMLLRNIIEKEVLLQLKNFKIPTILATENNILMLIQFVENTILSSYKKCIITGRMVEPRFRCYMPNKKHLFNLAVDSGFADDLVEYYIENEPGTLEYMIRNGAGPSSDEEGKYYYYVVFPDVYELIHRSRELTYDKIQNVLINFPSIEDLALYLHQGNLKEILSENDSVVSTFILIETNNNISIYRVTYFYNGSC